MTAILRGHQVITKMKFLTSFILFFSFNQMAQAQMFNQRTGLLSQTTKTRCESFSSNWTPGMNSNIVGYWKADGTVGAVADLATFTATTGASGVVNGATSTYSAGAIGQGLNFTGVAANYLSFGTPAAVNDLSTMTLMMWIKVPANTKGTLFYKSDGNSSQGWMFYIDTDYRLYFGVVRASANVQFKAHNTTAGIAGTWAQLVVTWNGVLASSGVHIYVNGVEWVQGGSGYSQDGSGNHDSDATQPLLFGKNAGGGGGSFNGALDEAAIWNRVLSPAEVAHLYKNQKCN